MSGETSYKSNKSRETEKSVAAERKDGRITRLHEDEECQRKERKWLEGFSASQRKHINSDHVHCVSPLLIFDAHRDRPNENMQRKTSFRLVRAEGEEGMEGVTEEVKRAIRRGRQRSQPT